MLSSISNDQLQYLWKSSTYLPVSFALNNDGIGRNARRKLVTKKAKKKKLLSAFLNFRDRGRTRALDCITGAGMFVYFWLAVFIAFPDRQGKIVRGMSPEFSGMLG